MTTPQPIGSRPNPTLTVRHGTLSTSLKGTGIHSITLCEHHVAGCALLLVDHARGSAGSFLIHSRTRMADGTVLFIATKDVREGTGKGVPMIELRFTGLTPRLAKLLETGHTYSCVTSGQEEILFVPFPRTEGQMRRVGAVIVGVPS